MEALISVVELRQYTLVPGQREVLIDVFDRFFVESQETEGMTIYGQFRDMDRTDRFVWLRGFADMAARARALAAFYSGPVWKAQAATANATMIDSDDVLLLRPATPDLGFGLLPPRPEHDATTPARQINVTVCSLRAAADLDVAPVRLLPALTERGVTPLAMFVEEPSENNFPALPVRSGEHVVVIVHTAADDGPDRAAAVAAEAALPGLIDQPVLLRLQPTARSQLR